MTKSTIAAGILGAAVATAGGVGAVSYYQQANQPVYAEITNVAAQYRTVEEPRQHCEDVEVIEQAAVKDENRVAGTLAGALIGGVFGNQVGSGSGKKLASIAGIAAGAYAGNKVQQNAQQKNTSTRTEQQCTTRIESKSVLTGYAVEYRIGDTTEKTTLKKKPTAARYQVKDNQPQFDQPVAENTDA